MHEKIEQAGVMAKLTVADLARRGLRFRPAPPNPRIEIDIMTSQLGQKLCLGTFWLGDAHDPKTPKHFEVGQRITVNGQDYAVTGKALILAPFADHAPAQDASDTTPSSSP